MKEKMPDEDTFCTSQEHHVEKKAPDERKFCTSQEHHFFPEKLILNQMHKEGTMTEHQKSTKKATDEHKFAPARSTI